MPMTDKQMSRTTSSLICLIAVLAALCVLLSIILLFVKGCNGCADNSNRDTPADTAADGTGTGSLPVDNPQTADVVLPATADAGNAYQDKLVFVGDSLTAHLISRGVLTDGVNTKQVWRTQSNMMNLNSEITNVKVNLPGTGEYVTIAEAAERVKPAILVITLGTDYGVSYLNEQDFKDAYTKLVKAVQEKSPNTKIILQSIFPVADNCKVLANAKIDTCNTWVKAIAAENGCRYLDTQSVLKDSRNNLKAEYCGSDDGIHLTESAYRTILQYIRTHALTE